jgi:hypothetical protein
VGPIPDFTDQELSVVRHLVEQRFRKPVTVELADAEVKLDALKEELTVCPTLFWRERGANFVVLKTGPARYRCQFFYHPTQHFGTGVKEYDNLGACTTTLLQLQADHEAQQAVQAPPPSRSK